MRDFRFIQDKANQALAFFEQDLQFVEGLKAGRKFHLEAWQRKIVSDLFGWLREDGRPCPAGAGPTGVCSQHESAAREALRGIAD